MSELPIVEPAFVSSSSTSAFSTGFLPVVSRRQPQRKQILWSGAPNWRCVVPDETGGRQVEGQITDLDFGALDNGLEEALSKSWDKLEAFQVGVVVEEEEEEEEEEEVKGKDGEKDGKIKEKSDIEDEGGKEESVSVADNVEDGVPDAAAFDVSAKGLESDGAVAAVEDAKAGKTKKGRKKKAVKSTATKKVTITKSKKKRGKKSLFDDDDDDDVVVDGNERALTKKELLHSQKWDSEPRWFFLQVKPGCEQSCAISIRNMARSLRRLEVQEVLVPVTTILRLSKGGQSVKKEERIFPGYILVLMVMNYQNYYDVQRVPNVQYFMGDPNRDKEPNEPFRPPIRVSDSEMKVVFDKVRQADSAKPEMKTQLRPGDSVEVLYGSFKGNMGRVKEVKPDSKIVTVQLMMFGRETPVELDLEQVKVVEDLVNIGELNEETDGEDESEDGDGKGVKDAETSASKPSDKGGAKAGKASAADDLAALLADVPSGADEEFFGMFKNEDSDDHAFGFLNKDDDSKKVKKDHGSDGQEEPFAFLDEEDKEPKGKKSARREGPMSDLDFLDNLGGADTDLSSSKPVRRKKGSRQGRGGDFDFLKDIGDGGNLPPAKDRVPKAGSKEGLISSDEELASFLSNENFNLWDSPAKKTSKQNSEAGVDRIKDIRSTETDRIDEGEDNLFAFLDEFDETVSQEGATSKEAEGDVAREDIVSEAVHEISLQNPLQKLSSGKSVRFVAQKDKFESADVLSGAHGRLASVDDFEEADVVPEVVDYLADDDEFEAADIIPNATDSFFPVGASEDDDEGVNPVANVKTGDV